MRDISGSSCPSCARGSPCWTSAADQERSPSGSPELSPPGRKLGVHLAEAGFEDVRVDARYERFTSTTAIAEFLAVQLDRAGHDDDGQSVRSWSEHSQGAMFAEAWVSAVAVKPT